MVVKELTEFPVGTAIIPSVEPVTKQMAYTHLRITPEHGVHPDDDWLCDMAIPAVRRSAEVFTGLVLKPIRYQLSMGAFQADMVMPKTPAISIEQVDYSDQAGVNQTILPANYELFDNTMHWQSGYSFPQTNSARNAVRIYFTAGDAAPEDVVMGMLLMLGDLYENREAKNELVSTSLLRPTGNVDWLWRPHRILMGMA